MLRRLHKGIAARIGTVLAALAVTSFVAPPIAVAFAPTPAAIHCLTHIKHEAGHDHAGSVQSGHTHDRDHADKPDKQADHKTICCGMFSITALAPDAGPAPLTYWRNRAVLTFVAPVIHPRAPDQPIRPPITRLPL